MKTTASLAFRPPQRLSLAVLNLQRISYCKQRTLQMPGKETSHLVIMRRPEGYDLQCHMDVCYKQKMTVYILLN